MAKSFFKFDVKNDNFDYLKIQTLKKNYFRCFAFGLVF